MPGTIEVQNGDELRLICPECHSMWSTTYIPSECPGCSMTVTIKAIPTKKIRNAAKAVSK